MKVYHFKQKQFVPSDIDTVWNFFSSPKNLSKITPPDMNFVISNITGPDTMYSGQLIAYKVSPFPLVRVNWITEIKNVEYKKYFIDEQKDGPFNMWYHQHFFTEKNGGVEMCDEISYAIPFGLLGRLANQILVKRQVNSIFEYRQKKIEAIFPIK
jgi:ligand-binding SRPBCC domain-containing protein